MSLGPVEPDEEEQKSNEYQNSLEEKVNEQGRKFWLDRPETKKFLAELESIRIEVLKVAEYKNDLSTDTTRLVSTLLTTALVIRKVLGFAKTGEFE